MTKNYKRIEKVLSQVLKLSAQPEYAKLFVDKLDTLFDEMLADRQLGIDGQDDPRGDQRDDFYTMGYVRGVDDSS